VEKAIQGTEEDLSAPQTTLTSEEREKSSKISEELQKSIIDQAGMDERTTTLEKMIRARETMRKMENQKIAEEAFQKAFDEALNGPTEQYKCVMGCSLYQDGKCRCWKGEPIKPSPTNYFTWEPNPHEYDHLLPPTQITKEVEMEDFINPTELTKSEMREIDKKMEEIEKGAEKEARQMGLEGWTDEDEKTYQDERLERHIQDHHTTNGHCSTGDCTGGMPGYNQKGPLTPGTDNTPPKEIIATAKIAVTESGTMTMETNKTTTTMNV
jgi:hypothetical protein